MRSVVLGLLAVAVPGCNQIFGLDPTVPVDAGIDVIEIPIDGPLPTARLTYLVALTDINSVPITEPALVDIEPAPDVQIGLLGGPLMPATYRAGGLIDLPYAFPSQAWRLVHTVDGVTREVQFPANAIAPHAVVPRFGRIERKMIPGPNSAYAVSPAGFNLGSHISLRMYTTGMWTTAYSTTTSGPEIRFNINGATPLSGPPGAPEMAKGDEVAIIDFQNSGACVSSRKSIVFETELGTGDSTPASTPAWPATYPARSIVIDEGAVVAARLQTALGTGATLQRAKMFGYAASDRMPAFTHLALGIPLPTPFMIPLLTCLNPATASMVFGEIPHFALHEVAHLQVTASRTVPNGGPTLHSGIEGIVRGQGSNLFSLPLPVSIPIAPFELAGTALATDDMSFTPATPTVDLTFGIESGSSAHYYTVVLHRVTGVLLDRVREYTVPATATPTVTIDSALLESGNRYVFEVRSYLGAPTAPQGDFTEYEAEQSSAVVFTRTFAVP